MADYTQTNESYGPQDIDRFNTVLRQSPPSLKKAVAIYISYLSALEEWKEQLDKAGIDKYSGDAPDRPRAPLIDDIDCEAVFLSVTIDDEQDFYTISGRKKFVLVVECHYFAELLASYKESIKIGSKPLMSIYHFKIRKPKHLNINHKDQEYVDKLQERRELWVAPRDKLESAVSDDIDATVYKNIVCFGMDRIENQSTTPGG
ncbi:hypothetical protein BDV95DRAFT_606527 [Massariosphaeria phaeospora]|uniref:Uncharacterized protein n=1 Tax=Massariosphaeria phaeospora TaxID=100035 RepID=A0A7C8M8W7_9PLEO|nr:hypothetical protein BDV95DRAFT_606527 [Massariosphaeria phaeospora]